MPYSKGAETERFWFGIEIKNVGTFVMLYLIYYEIIVVISK